MPLIPIQPAECILNGLFFLHWQHSQVGHHFLDTLDMSTQQSAVPYKNTEASSAVQQ